MYKIAIVGSGNVAWHLTKRLAAQNIEITVLARNKDKLVEFKKTFNVQTVPQIKPLKDIDLYILAVKDTAIAQVAEKLKNQPIVHSSGSIEMDLLSFYSDQFGVIYPFQTFRMQTHVEWEQIPVFIEACCPRFEQTVNSIARLLSPNVFYLSSQKRQYLHLAGVFTNNFINHLLAITRQILQSQGLNYEWIFPLLQKTIENAMLYDPIQVQTGPAVRNDKIVLQKHLQLLQNPDWQQVYTVLSKSISRMIKSAADLD